MNFPPSASELNTIEPPPLTFEYISLLRRCASSDCWRYCASCSVDRATMSPGSRDGLCCRLSKPQAFFHPVTALVDVTPRRCSCTGSRRRRRAFACLASGTLSYPKNLLNDALKESRPFSGAAARFPTLTCPTSRHQTTTENENVSPGEHRYTILFAKVAFAYYMRPKLKYKGVGVSYSSEYALEKRPNKV